MCLAAPQTGHMETTQYIHLSWKKRTVWQRHALPTEIWTQPDTWNGMTAIPCFRLPHAVAAGSVTNIQKAVPQILVARPIDCAIN